LDGSLLIHEYEADIQLERGHILVQFEQTESTGNEKEQLSDRTGIAQLGLRRL
jgi:hypothetical protein